MKHTMTVQGMTCGNCKKAVQDALTNVSGVQSVDVHLDTRQVEVTYDEAIVQLGQLKEAVENHGYDVEE